MNHTPSPQQQDVLDWVQKDTGSLNPPSKLRQTTTHLYDHYYDVLEFPCDPNGELHSVLTFSVLLM